MLAMLFGAAAIQIEVFRAFSASVMSRFRRGRDLNFSLVTRIICRHWRWSRGCSTTPRRLVEVEVVVFRYQGIVFRAHFIHARTKLRSERRTNDRPTDRSESDPTFLYHCDTRPLAERAHINYNDLRCLMNTGWLTSKLLIV